MRLTRNSFKRRIITAGIAIFSTLAVSTTGFAAWVLSTTATKDQEGGVQVGVVEKSEISISDLTFANQMDDFYFEPAAGDNTGRVRIDNGDDVQGENMVVIFSCTIGNAGVVADLSVNYTEPKNIAAAVSQGFLVSPNLGVTGTADADGNVVYTIPLKADGEIATTLPNGWTYTESNGTGTLTCSISYNWGAKFGGLNPGKYYDEDAAGKLVSDSEMETTLHTFKAVCHGMSTEEYMVWYLDNTDEDPDNDSELSVINYKVLISASA